MTTDKRAVAARVYELFDSGDVAGLDSVMDSRLVDHKSTARHEFWHRGNADACRGLT
jgi:hypothetical protein